MMNDTTENIMKHNTNPTNAAITEFKKQIRATTTKTTLDSGNNNIYTIRVYQAYNDKIADAAIAANSFQGPLDAGYWSKSRMTWIKPSAVWMAYRCGWTELKNDPNQRRVLAIDISLSYLEKLLHQAKVNHSKTRKAQRQQKCDDMSTTKKNENTAITTKRKDNNTTSSTDTNDCPVIVQWDPERYMDINQENKKQVYTSPDNTIRSIQIGLRGSGVDAFLDPNFVIKITDVTQNFRNALHALQNGNVLQAKKSLWPDDENTEQVINLSNSLKKHLGITMTTEEENEAAKVLTADDNNNMIDKDKKQIPISKSTCTKKKSTIVVLGSAANPPHQGHLYCLNVGKAKAEELGYQVMWGTIAIAPRGYVQQKMKRINGDSKASSTAVFPDEDRLHLLDLLCSNAMTNMEVGEEGNNNSGSISDNETPSSGSFYYMIPNKCYGSALECGRALRPSKDTTIIIVVGGDRCKRKWRRSPSSKGDEIVTVCCPRNSEQLQSLLQEFYQDKEDGKVFDPNYHFSSHVGKLKTTTGEHTTTSLIGPPVSSTIIRAILMEDEHTTALEKLTNHGYCLDAAKYLLDRWRVLSANER